MNGTSLWIIDEIKETLLQIQGLIFVMISFSLAALLWQRARNSSQLNLALKNTTIITFFSVSLIAFVTFIYSWGINRLPMSLAFAIATGFGVLRPALSLCFLLSILLMRPWELAEPDPLMLAMPKYWAGITIGSWLLHSLINRQIKLVWNQACTMISLLTFWTILSLIKTGDFESNFKNYFDNFFRTLLLFFLIINLLKDRLDLAAFRTTLTLSTMTLGFMGLYRTFNDTTLHDYNRLWSFGLLGDPNYLSAVLILALPFAIEPLFTKSAHLIYKLTALINLSIVGFVIFLARSRGSIIAILGMIAAFFVFKVKRKSTAIFTTLLILSSLAPITSFMGRQTSDLEGSSSSRLNYWKTGIIMAIKNPILGVGFDSYPKNYDSYSPTVGMETGLRTAHSSWILALAETGFPGLFLFVSLFFLVFRLGFKLRETSPAFIYSMIGYGIAMSFLSTTWTLHPYLLFGFVLTAYRINTESTDSIDLKS